MLRLVLCGAIAATALLAAPANFSSAEAKVYNLKYADIGPPRGPRAKALMWWAKELESRSNGNIKIKWYWSQSLVKGKATMKAVGSRIADVGTVIGIYHPAEFPVWNYANTPFLHSDAWVGMRTWYELRQIVPEIKAETDKHKITMIANNTTGPVQLLMAKKAVTTVAGLKGMKIRTSGGWTHLFKALGAVPVKIGFGELYAALDRGTIDGTINYTPFVKSYKHYEVACCLTEAAMGQVLGYGIGMNTKLLNSMPADIRSVVVNTSVEYMDVYARYYIESMEEAQVSLQAGIDGRKVKILKLSKAEEDKFRAAAASFTIDWKKKISKKGMDPDAILAKIKMVHAKWTKRLKEKGYPWAPK